MDGGYYVGGLLGFEEGPSTGIMLTSENLSIDNSNILGMTGVGGIAGYSWYSKLSDIDVMNSFISGTSNVGGAVGYAYSLHTRCYENLNITNSEINGKTENIGGVFGDLQNCTNGILNITVSECNIVASLVDSENIGGIIGRVSRCSPINKAIVKKVSIQTKGKNVGGVVGEHSGAEKVVLVNGVITEVNITGSSNIGGVLGFERYTIVENSYVNVNIIADTHTAGGIVGYANNIYANAATDNTIIVNTLVLDTEVSAPSKAGGLIGDIATEIYRDGAFCRNNYIDADITSTNTSTGSLIIGGRPDENDYIKNTYVYKYSKLNDDYVYATNDNIDSAQYLVRNDLDNQNTYLNKIGLGTTYWNYESLAKGKYPTIKDSYLYQPELQIGVDLPTDPEITEINLLNENNDRNDNENNTTTQNDITAQNSTKTENTETLPNYKAYPISANEINIDFNKMTNEYNAGVNGDPASFQSETKLMINEVNTKEKVNEQQAEQSLEDASTSTTFTYYINGQEQETVELSNSTNQTYTLKYNFKGTIEIKLSNGQDEKSIMITPEDVRSEASLVGGNNAYLLDSNLYINGELQQGEYVNVYEGYALRSDGTVMNIATGEIVENEETSISNNANTSQTYLEQDKETYLEQTQKPLNTYEYKGNTIEVYGTYSKINGNIKLQIYNVRNGKLSAISNSLDMKIGNNITDNYNNKEYQTILNTSGELVDLKEMLKYPDNFLTRNIKQIVQNTDEEKTEVMVLYNTGKVIVFNYVSGEVIYETNENADEGLTDYITGSIENIWNDYEEKRQEYAKSKELEQKLAELPIEKAINTNGNGNTTNEITPTIDNDYITIYNAETGKYEVYSENEILKGSEEIPVSETEKIEQNGLEGIYGYNAKEEIKPQTNGAIIVVSIIAIAIIALVLLRRLVLKNNIKKKR